MRLARHDPVDACQRHQQDVDHQSAGADAAEQAFIGDMRQAQHQADPDDEINEEPNGRTNGGIQVSMGVQENRIAEQFRAGRAHGNKIDIPRKTGKNSSNSSGSTCAAESVMGRIRRPNRRRSDECIMVRAIPPSEIASQKSHPKSQALKKLGLASAGQTPMRMQSTSEATADAQRICGRRVRNRRFACGVHCDPPDSLYLRGSRVDRAGVAWLICSVRM